MPTGGALKQITNGTQTMKAAAALTGGKLVKLTANENEVNLAVANTDKVIGVTLEDQSIVTEGVNIATMGEVWCTAGAAVAIGDDITSDASGRGVPAGAGVGVQMFVIGRALSAASGVGVDFRLLIQPWVKNNAIT